VRDAAAAAVPSWPILALACPRAQAGVVFTNETTLVFAGGILAVDQPDLARNVIATESGGSLVVESPGHPIAVPMADAARCTYVDTSSLTRSPAPWAASAMSTS
jgi:hypothetical protein